MGASIRRVLRFSAWTAGAGCVVMLSLFYLVNAFFNGWCGNDVVQRLAAPDGRHTAFLFQRDCGATTGFSTQVSVYPTTADKRLPNAPGNAFTAAEGSGPMGYWQGPLVHIRWVDSNRLEISHYLNANVYVQSGQVGSVRIQHRSE